MAINSDVRNALIDAVKAVPCRPLLMNFPNEVQEVKTKTLPYMNVLFLSEGVEEELMDGVIKTQLVQIDLYIEQGSDLTEMDKYKDSLQEHFRSGADFGCFDVNTPPAVLSQGEDDVSYTSQLSFTIEYFDES